jgi:glycosyltransferase involved in cell wall biosynthesis
VVSGAVGEAPDRGAQATIGPRPSGRPPSLVTVIVPARNSATTLAEQLDALAGQDFDGAWELVLADNGSTDDTVAVFERAVRPVADRPARPWTEARVIDASGRSGSAHARNEAAAAAHGDLLCFCDADDVVDRSWLTALVRAAAEHHLVGGRLELERLNSSRVRSWRPAPTASFSDAPSFASTSNLAVWADCFRSLGGLDEEYLKSHDVEFCKRALGAGADLGFAPDAVVHYRLRSTLRGLARQAYRSGRASVQMATQFPERERPVTGRVVARRVMWSATRAPFVLVADRRGIWVRRTAELAGVVVALGRRRVARWRGDR